MVSHTITRSSLCLAAFVSCSAAAADLPSLKAAKSLGRKNSSLVGMTPPSHASSTTANPHPQIAEYRARIAPILRMSCVKCHGPEEQEGDFRVDTLDPDLLEGADVDWWLEVYDVLSNGEMPPEDNNRLADEKRGRIISWLSQEIQTASQVRRAERGHTSFRRLTRYEYNYAIQDLLGLPYDFAKDLPPETPSEDGFKNSSEMLQMSAMQLDRYRDLARQALLKATVRGERPEPIYFCNTMEAISAQTWKERDEKLDIIRERYKDDPEALKQQLQVNHAKYAIKPGSAHFQNVDTGQSVRAKWGYGNAKNAPLPVTMRPAVPKNFPVIAILPQNQTLTIDLRDVLPDQGNLRVRALASRTTPEAESVPTLSLLFGHQASNNSRASERVGVDHTEISAPPGSPEFYQWDIPLSELIRNPYRSVTKIGTKPNPAEYVRFKNTSLDREDIHLAYVEVIAHAYDQWPPASHRRIFFGSPQREDERKYARAVLTEFMQRAWRGPVSAVEVEGRIRLFDAHRQSGIDFQDAVMEVLATVLSSPRFLYVTQMDADDSERLSDFELATRLSLFLWCSVPDGELLSLAERGKLTDPTTLVRQTKRMLADEKSQRFSKQFVRQWLAMELLDHLEFDEKTYGKAIDAELKAAMQQEPVEYFNEILRTGGSVMDFLHADYVVVNEPLAGHYELPGVRGREFRRVALGPQSHRGGLLTQSGLLAMNSDGKDSHPLKRGIWLLERLLNDPPPPPPPNVPEVDLTDPRILQMTLKERIADHRNHAACYSCHARIDPWGIAFENFDAIGAWRTRIGKKPIDSTSELFNQQKLEGMDGLKRFLLTNRQDQFARALVHKMCSYALGRPLTFGDRAQVDQLTRDFRQRHDRLDDLIELIVASDLFLTK